jgi:hypothetical protein
MATSRLVGAGPSALNPSRSRALSADAHLLKQRQGLCVGATLLLVHQQGPDGGHIAAAGLLGQDGG